MVAKKKDEIKAPEAEVKEEQQEAVQTEVAEEELIQEVDAVAEEEAAVEPKTGKKEEAKKAEKKAAHPEKKVVLTPKKYAHGKKYRAIEAEIEKGKDYPLDEAIKLVSNKEEKASLSANILKMADKDADVRIANEVIKLAGK